MGSRTETVIPRHIIRPQGGGPQPVLSDADVAEMVRLHVELGRTRRELAGQFHVHPSTVGRYLRGAGAQVRRAPYKATRFVDQEELLHALQLAGQGYSARDIAWLLDRHPTTIREWLRRYARDPDWRLRRHRIPASVNLKGL